MPTKFITMKRLFSIILIAVTLFSCSNDDNSVPAPTDLQKVVFYRNSPEERHWNIANHLLTNITYADGTLAEEYTYDNLGRVTKETKYTTAGVVSETNVITYNEDNTIRTINSLPYIFNASTRVYTYSYGSNFTISCKVNSDFLVENFVRTGFNAGEYHMTYADGNMLSFEKGNSGVTEVTKNFHISGVSNMGTQFYNAILAVGRVKSLTDPNFFVDGQASKTIADGYDKGSTDPYYYNYGQIPDMHGKLLQVGIEVLDSNNNPVSSYPFADYYLE